MNVELQEMHYEGKLAWVLMVVDGTPVGRFSTKERANEYLERMIAKGKRLKRSVKFIR